VRGVKAWARAAEKAVVKSWIAWTSERMFLGALVKAYSRVVTEAKISEMAMRT
jgi:hypothetical protein